MLSERLKEETRESHVAVERTIIPRLKKIDTKEAYLAVLLDFYGYFKPVEEKINAFVDETVVPDFAERRKAVAIKKDIDDLNGSAFGQNFCHDLPLINSTATALGALYVLEGSTVGGIHISDMIASRITLNTGLGFFRGYGAKAGQMWQSFKTNLDEVGADRLTQDEVVAAADDTFNKFQNWLENNSKSK